MELDNSESRNLIGNRKSVFRMQGHLVVVVVVFPPSPGCQFEPHCHPKTWCYGVM